MTVCFIAWAADTSAATGPPTPVATAAVAGTVKTLLQLKANASQPLSVVEWGYTFDATPVAPVRMELVVTGTVAATVTTLGAGARPFNNPAVTSVIQVGTAASGFNATAEGTITASRLGDYHYENGLYLKKQYPLGREFELAPGEVLRIRATPTSAAAINVMPYIIWEE